MCSPTIGIPIRPQTVILWDQNANRRQFVTELVESCGARTYELQHGELNQIESSASQAIALVALGRNSANDTSSFGAIQALKLGGHHIISYEDGLFELPIGTRCRALLNGSTLLLDSAAQTFTDELRQTLLNAWKNETEHQVEEEQIRQHMQTLGIVGVSEKMTSLVRWILRVSSLSDFPVLINGETGTGKELIANALHRLDSKRSKGPFIAANCSAISSGLAESELFGHRRGAFTGADADRKGLFRSAEGGVLFLDEIGELEQSLQAKLLRALQEERVLGVGFDKEVAIDVRVIAATNRNLETMVREGKFREDLYHRLNVLSVSVPPLRERREDLEPLTEHFIKKYSRLGNTPTSVGAEFLEALGRMKLSGNARQLENIVRRALLNGAGKSSLSLSDLTTAEWEQLASEEQSDRGADIVLPAVKVDSRSSFKNILDLHGWNLGKALEYCERALLECALQHTGGNQSQTARLMGITPRSVYNKLQKHNLRTI